MLLYASGAWTPEALVEGSSTAQGHLVEDVPTVLLEQLHAADSLLSSQA